MSHTPTIRCRCTGCQGPPICRCCNEPVVEIPDDEPAAHEDPRAEAAILSAAEAYRLVVEARMMRFERDAARAEIRTLRERLQRADHLAEVVSRAMIIAQCREACDHPACLIIRAIVAYRTAALEVDVIP